MPWFEDLVASIGAVLDVTPPVARLAGELRARRETARRPVARADMQIAATALVHGLAIATRNVDDFEDCEVSIVDPFVGTAKS